MNSRQQLSNRNMYEINTKLKLNTFSYNKHLSAGIYGQLVENV